MNMRLSLSAAGLFLTLFASAQAAEHSVAYPEGYRTWLHAKSMLIQRPCLGKSVSRPAPRLCQ